MIKMWWSSGGIGAKCLQRALTQMLGVLSKGRGGEWGGGDCVVLGWSLNVLAAVV